MPGEGALMNCVCAGSWEKVTEFPKEGDCGAFSSFCRHVVAAISSALLQESRGALLDLDRDLERLQKAQVLVFQGGTSFLNLNKI